MEGSQWEKKREWQSDTGGRATPPPRLTCSPVWMTVTPRIAIDSRMEATSCMGGRRGVD